MMEDGNGRKKVWICLSIVVLAAVVIGAVYYMNMPKEHYGVLRSVASSEA